MKIWQKNANRVILILSLLSYPLSSCVHREESSIYILPKGYSGYVIVLYNRSDGIDKKYKEGKRFYEIPASGILKTKFSADYESSGLPELYYGEINKDNKIPVIVDLKDFSETTVNTTLPSLGKAYKSLDGSAEIEFAILYIGTKREIINSSSKIEQLNVTEL